MKRTTQMLMRFCGSKEIPGVSGFGGLAGVVLLQALLGAQTSQKALMPPPPIAVELQTFILPSEFELDKLLGRVDVRTLEKQVIVHWSYDGGGQQAFFDEPFDLNYWPTAAARISDSRLYAGTNLLVAGKRPGIGTTIIERWQLSFSGLPGSGSPTAVTKSTLYDANANGKRIVRLMEPINSLQGKALVQFHDSDNLYLIDAVSGQLTLIATPVQVPKLSEDGLKLMVAGRIGGTYVYAYVSDFTYGDHGALIMHDDDGDGIIDVWTPLANIDEWETFSNPSPFTENYLD